MKETPLSEMLSRFGGLSTLAEKLGDRYTLYAQHPRWALMRTVGRFDVASRLTGSFHPFMSNDAPVQGPSVFEDLDVDQACTTLATDGYYPGITLPALVVEELLEYAQRSICYGDRNPDHGFRYQDRAAAEAKYGRSFTLGNYSNIVADCPAVQRLTTDGKLWRLASQYLRCSPVLQGAVLWWSFPNEETSFRSLAAQMYHFDLDDYRFLKFFFYLTDVDSERGPHVCVLGTHRRKRLKDQVLLRRHPDDYIHRNYAGNPVLSITGPAGSGFAEDTRCFHKGEPPRSGDRLVFQLEFARNDYGLQHDAVRLPAQPARNGRPTGEEGDVAE